MDLSGKRVLVTGASLIERVEDEAGPIDVLVDNAGVDTVAALADTPPPRRLNELIVVGVPHQERR